VIDLAVVIRFGLLLVRPGMLVMVAPSLGGTYAPAPVKVATTVLLALVLAPTVSVAPAATDVSLTLIIAREVVIGLSLGLAVRALVGAAELGGHLSGYQIGFSYAATIDPVSGVRNSVITSLYGLLAMLAFFAVNGHHQVLRALVASYDGLPIGGGHVDASLLASVREILGLIFIAGLRLAAPLVLGARAELHGHRVSRACRGRPHRAGGNGGHHPAGHRDHRGAIDRNRPAAGGCLQVARCRRSAQNNPPRNDWATPA